MSSPDHVDVTEAASSTPSNRPQWLVDPMFHCFARGRMLDARAGRGPSVERTVRALDEAFAVLTSDGHDLYERYPPVLAAYRAALAENRGEAAQRALDRVEVMASS